MLKLRPFLEKVYTASQQYDSDFSGDVIDGVGFRWDGTITGASTVFDDASARLLGAPEVVQSEDVLIRMEGADWFHLSALLSGGYGRITNGDDGGASEIECYLNFRKLVDKIPVVIQAVQHRVYLRGAFGALASYGSSAPSAIAGTLRPWCTTTDRSLAGGFLKPRIYQLTFPLDTASSDLQRKLDFDQSIVIAGLMLRTADASANAARVDGLIRGVRWNVVSGSTPSGEKGRMRWGMLRQFTQHFAGFSDDDVTASRGVALVPVRDPLNAAYNGALMLHAGDSIELHFDTSSTVERGYTAVTPASGDLVTITVLGFVASSGSGDMGVATERRSFGRRSRG